MTLRLQPTKIATGSADEDGLLVFQREFLVAVLVRLSPDHADNAGKLFLEAGFGTVADALAPLFDDLDAAQGWIAHRLSADNDKGA